jgi:DNA-binding beta-propeller fold protein YncE
MAPTDVAVSPDGKNVYVSSQDSNAITIFDRDPATGTLTQKQGMDGCISEGGSEGVCRKGRALGVPFDDAVVSPDGRNVYIASEEPGAVAIFDRTPDTGALRQSHGPSGCVAEDGAHGACRKGRALKEAQGIAVSPDGASVYVASGSISADSTKSNAVAIFDRDRKTGALAQKQDSAGCIADAGTGGSCQKGRGLDGAGAVAVSPNGKNVYITGYYAGGVTTFDRQLANGALAQKPGAAGCISDYEKKSCLRTVVLLGLPIDLATSPDGRSVYVVGAGFEGLVLSFDRSRATGALSTEVRGINGND